MIMEKERITDYEELKQQLNALRERIDASTQISDSMIRKAIGRNMDSLRIRGILSVAVCVAALILVELILVSFGVSTLFLVVTAVFLGVNAWLAFVMRIRKMSYSPESNLVETAKRVVKFKKDNELSLMIGLPLALVWCIWAVYEMGVATGMEDIKEFAFLGCCAMVGALIGGFAGYFGMFRPAMHEADEILSQIEDLNRTV